MVCYLIDYHKCEFICTTITQNELEYYWHQKNPSTRSLSDSHLFPNDNHFCHQTLDCWPTDFVKL